MTTCHTAGRWCRLRNILMLFVCGSFLTLSNCAQAQGSNANWHTGPDADKFWSQLSQSPYAETGGSGFTMYMLTYSSCPNCLNFLHDFWEPRKSKVQLREIFVPINQPRFLDEAADMALTRNPAFADAYYHHTRTAPPVSSSPDRQDALNRVANFVTQANTYFRQIGHIQDGYPTFIFHARDEATGKVRLYIVSGWGPEFAAQLEKWAAQGPL